MLKFIFFSKTMYSETPRIRHQLADLLIANGNEVIFYQRPLYFFQPNYKLQNNKINESLKIKQTKQFLHHQLRLIKPFSQLNSIYEYNSIKQSLDENKDQYIIINFNYDYDFLRRIFPINKIITIINDDFVAQSKFNKGKHVLSYLSRTLRNSDTTLTVSLPLWKQAKQFTQDVEMFLPWAQEEYIQPGRNSERNRVLLWAHIDSRIDFNLIEYTLKNCRSFILDLVGPISDKNLNIINNLKLKYNNLNVIKPTKLNELPLDSYFATIIPYRAHVPDIEAVTASNKTFQLLSKGLPLITYGMPHFLEHDAIFKCNSYSDFLESLNICHQRFYELQDSISKLIDENTSFVRYNQIIKTINK